MSGHQVKLQGSLKGKNKKQKPTQFEEKEHQNAGMLELSDQEFKTSMINTSRSLGAPGWLSC